MSLNIVNIDNYENIEKLVHKKLSTYHYGKEFFECDLEKCILTIKHIADSQSRYSEAYKDQQTKDMVEGNDSKYLSEQRYKQERARRYREEKTRREIAERLERERELYQQKERERIEREKYGYVYKDYIGSQVTTEVSAARVAQIDRERKEQRAREEQRRKAWSNNKSMYAINYKKENKNHQQQDNSDAGSEIFTIFFVLVLIPLAIYLIMQ